MIYLNEINNEKTFNLKQTKAFLKACKGNKYECFFKLIMTYGLSRIELVCLEWDDVDFENNTITIYPISQERTNQIYYKWEMEKKEHLGRTFPLLPNIKKLLLEIREKQSIYKILNDDYDFSNERFICLKNDGTRFNFNTLSRNLRYIARDNNLPEILLSGLSICLDNFICEKARDYDYYRAWTRFDCKYKKSNNNYVDFNFNKNKKLLNAINDLLECENQSRKSDMEMWGADEQYERTIWGYVY